MSSVCFHPSWSQVWPEDAATEDTRHTGRVCFLWGVSGKCKTRLMSRDVLIGSMYLTFRQNKHASFT